LTIAANTIGRIRIANDTPHSSDTMNRSQDNWLRLSIIVATRNRADALAGCLGAIEVALARTGRSDAEIIVVDNGSMDNTGDVLAAAKARAAVPFHPLHEARPGKARALNVALRAARGDLLVFTDDDCHLHPDHLVQALRYDDADAALVVRSGRIELGDPTDLPVTIDLSPERMQWSRRSNSARFENIAQHVAGANMTMRRALVERIGLFDEDFGPWAPFGPNDDTDYAFRAYLSGAVLEHVPDMTVLHFHGRKKTSEGLSIMRGYLIGSGALYIKYVREHPNLCRPFVWDLVNAGRDLLRGRNTFLPALGVSHVDKVCLSLRGGWRYLVRVSSGP
jgi:glycosyltransferase involved in cell wall biosynthesis